MLRIHILALDATRQGGAGVYTWRLIRALAERGHDVRLICHEACDEVKRLAIVHEIRRPKSARRFGLWRFSSLLQIWDYKRALKALKLPAPDVVIGSAQPMLWAYSTLYPRRPFVYLPHSLVAPVELQSYNHGTEIQRRFAIAAYRYMERKCLERSRVTVRFTETGRQALRDYYGETVCGQLVVVSMPVDCAEVAESERRGGGVRLLSVGRLITSKNLLFVLKILAKMSSMPWTLDIVGSGEERTALEEFVFRANMRDRVVFHGHLDDVADFYRSADLFVFPSILESFGFVLLEAMSNSLPTLSFLPNGKTVQTASDEFVTHGTDGLLAKSAEDFAMQLQAAISGKIDLKIMGKAARCAVIERHQWDTHIGKIEPLLASVADS